MRCESSVSADYEREAPYREAGRLEQTGPDIQEHVPSTRKDSAPFDSSKSSKPSRHGRINTRTLTGIGVVASTDEPDVLEVGHYNTLTSSWEARRHTSWQRQRTGSSWRTMLSYPVPDVIRHDQRVRSQISNAAVWLRFSVYDASLTHAGRPSRNAPLTAKGRVGRLGRQVGFGVKSPLQCLLCRRQGRPVMADCTQLA